ncbi:MFS general substrate transporter [Phlegmacium glaucopus]|nr:MFS general substrate transporter [Phlegmacium glaucopus]
MEKESPAHVYIESHKETHSGDPHDDGVLLENDLRASAERRLLKKLDYRLLPTIVVIYITNYIDRSAVTSARLSGLEQDLHLTPIQYSVVLAIIFAAYCPAQIPSNMIVNNITRPSVYIGTCVILWGLTSLLAGVVRNFAGLVACRIFIGFPEAAFYPGSMYLLSRWYTRKELALRSCILYAGFIISNAFGALMAAGILNGMEGKLGTRGWRWLFYVEGAITIFVGLQAVWLLPDHPHNTWWLSPAEQHLARVRLAEDTGEADEDGVNDTPWRGLKLALKDPKVYMFAMFGFCEILGLGFINFFPTLAATLGFTTTITLLLAAPPWILATVLCIINARHADMSGERYWHITSWLWAVVFGFIIAQSTMSISGRYVSMFLMASGYVGSSMTLVWVSNSIPRPPSKRAASLALVNGFANLGNLVTSFVWKVEWSPQFRPSMIIGICGLLVAMIFAFAVRTMLIRENKQMDQEYQLSMDEAKRERIEQAAKLEGITIAEAMEKQRGFRYLY